MNATKLKRLLEASLALWGYAGSLRIDGDNAVILMLRDGAAYRIERIEAAHARMPRWRVHGVSPPRAATPLTDSASIRGMLRALRLELDPRFVPTRVLLAREPSIYGSES